MDFDTYVKKTAEKKAAPSPREEMLGRKTFLLDFFSFWHVKFFFSSEPPLAPQTPLFKSLITGLRVNVREILDMLQLWWMC